MAAIEQHQSFNPGHENSRFECIADGIQMFCATIRYAKKIDA
jgi:hypothetical protein